MILGAVVGALAMHAGRDTGDQWLFVPVAVMVLGAVELHDAALEPPEGWGAPRQNSVVGVTDAAKPLLGPADRAEATAAKPSLGVAAVGGDAAGVVAETGAACP